jgi:hypothetical protein
LPEGTTDKETRAEDTVTVRIDRADAEQWVREYPHNHYVGQALEAQTPVVPRPITPDEFDELPVGTVVLFIRNSSSSSNFAWTKSDADWVHPLGSAPVPKTYDSSTPHVIFQPLPKKIELTLPVEFARERGGCVFADAVAEWDRAQEPKPLQVGDRPTLSQLLVAPVGTTLCNTAGGSWVVIPGQKMSSSFGYNVTSITDFTYDSDGTFAGNWTVDYIPPHS